MEILNDNVILDICNKLNIKEEQAKSVLEMLKDEKTVAFIARYRKEMTGGLDEEQIRLIEDEYNYGVSLNKKKEDVIRLIEEKGLLTEDLKNEILAQTKLIDIEDLYRPYKEKKKTKATEAIALGLEPLADIMLKLWQKGDKIEIASKYITDKVKSVEEAITQAKYIVAERISDVALYRKHIRDAALKYGTISTTKKKNDKDIEEKYKNYYDSTEFVSRIKPHRILAIDRAEDEDVISVSVNLQPERDVEYLKYKVIKNRDSIFKEELSDAIMDSYKRLIAPSISREIRAILTEKAAFKRLLIFIITPI